ncbi:MAG: hypothetical protein IJ996_00755 [Clostridia bacterium]|nr:hypothetical protein [Clostridia bacterium]
MTKKISSAYLWGFILAIVAGLTAFFYESFIGFPTYVDSLPEGSTEGLGIFGIIIFGIYAIVGAAALAIMSIIAYVSAKKQSPETIKGIAWFGIIVLFLLAGACIFYGILMCSVYLGGWFGKIIYFGSALTAIVLAILNIIRLAKLNSQKE